MSSQANHLHELFHSSSPSRSEHNGVIFSRVMTIYLHEANSNISPGKTIQLTVELDTNINEIRKEVSIRLLDSNDPFFIYLYLIDATEYENIKSSQNLLISFDSFPNKLKNLLELCTSTSQSDSKSNFVLCLRNLSHSSLTLEIMELNEFKNFLHLSFVIPSASEEFIRNTFCASYRKLKCENESLLRTVENLDAELSTVTISKSKEIQNVKNDFDNEKQYLKNKIADIERDYKIEKEKLFEVERTLKSTIVKHQLELKNRDELIERNQTQYEHKCTELKDKFNQELMKKNSKIKSLDDKVKLLISEHEQQKCAKEKASHSLKKYEAELDSVKIDLLKANEIIRKLQNEVNNSHGKLDMLNQVSKQQMEAVNIRESTVEKLANELKTCLQQMKLKDKDIGRMRKELKLLQSKTLEANQQLIAKKQLISDLNKKLENVEIIDDCETVPKSSWNSELIRKQKSEVEKTNQTNGLRKNVDFMLESQRYPVIDNPKNSLFTHLDSEAPLKSVNLKTTRSSPTGNVLPLNRISNRKQII